MTLTYTPDEVRQMARTSRQQVVIWRREGKLVGIRIGSGSRKKHYRYTQDSVHKLLKTGGNGEAP